jgi:hypothetical protein
VPRELTDASNTLRLPDAWAAPASRHHYIASLDVLQKTALRTHLTSRACNVELAERADARATHGADLLLDADTALLLVPLAPLPANGAAAAATARLAALSWDFERVVVVFEAFSSALAYRGAGAGAGLAPYAFPPAVL